MRHRILLAGGLAATAAFAVTLPASGASAPQAPTSCSVAKAAGGYEVSWTAPAAGATPVGYKIVEQGYWNKPVVKASASARSVLWTAPVRDTADIRFTVRAYNKAGNSQRCLTAPADGAGSSTPAPPTSPTATPTTSPTVTPTTTPTTSPTATPTTSPDTTDRVGTGTSGLLPYSANSFFRSSVVGAPVDGARTSSFRQFMATHPDQGGKGITWPKMNVSNDWAMSYHVHDKGDNAPVWRLTGGNTSHAKLRILTTQGFHMDDAVADTFPTGDQDRPGVMIDNEFGYTVQFADAVPNKATRTIDVSNAAIMWHGSNGLDYRNPKSDDSRNFTSRGRIIDAMIIRRDVLEQAIAKGTGLGHVLHLFFVETKTTDGVVHPMVGAEGDKEGWGAEGERIRIAPSIDLEARGLTGACLAVARTLQENGGYLGDNSGSSTQIKASQSHRYSGMNLTTDCMKGKVSWNDFEVVQKGWQN